MASSCNRIAFDTVIQRDKCIYSTPEVTAQAHSFYQEWNMLYKKKTIWGTRNNSALAFRLPKLLQLYSTMSKNEHSVYLHSKTASVVLPTEFAISWRKIKGLSHYLSKCRRRSIQINTMSFACGTPCKQRWFCQGKLQPAKHLPCPFRVSSHVADPQQIFRCGFGAELVTDFCPLTSVGKQKSAPNPH